MIGFRKIALVATAVAALGLAGCGTGQSPAPSAKPSGQQAPGELGDVQRILNSVDSDMGGDPR